MLENPSAEIVERDIQEVLTSKTSDYFRDFWPIARNLIRGLNPPIEKFFQLEGVLDSQGNTLVFDGVIASADYLLEIEVHNDRVVTSYVSFADLFRVYIQQVAPGKEGDEDSSTSYVTADWHGEDYYTWKVRGKLTPELISFAEYLSTKVQRSRTS